MDDTTEIESNAIIDSTESNTVDRKRMIDFIYMQNDGVEWRTKRKTYRKPATTINDSAANAKSRSYIDTNADSRGNSKKSLFTSSNEVTGANRERQNVHDMQ